MPNNSREPGRFPQNIEAALKELRREENQLKVTDLVVPGGEQAIRVIGVEDIDPERNLGDYQNTTYFVMAEGARTVVVDPGIRQGGWIRETLGIDRCDVIFTHFHLDHWIGCDAYKGQAFYASPICRAVLSKMVGIERTGKSIFFEGRLTDYHRRSTPVRAVNDAERLLPIREEIREINGEIVYRNQELALEFFELPFGQTEGTLYGVLQTPETKVIFASDLFVIIRDQLRVEPHYAFKSKEMVLQDIAVALKAVLGEEVQHESLTPVYQEHLKKLASPGYLALGHGVFNFRANRGEVQHLLHELEELLRIEREHII